MDGARHWMKTESIKYTDVQGSFQLSRGPPQLGHRMHTQRASKSHCAGLAGEGFMEEVQLELVHIRCWGPFRRGGRTFEKGGIQGGLKVQGGNGQGGARIAAARQDLCKEV